MCSHLYQRQVNQVPSCVWAQYRVGEAGPGEEKHEVEGLEEAVAREGVTKVPGF